MISLPLNNFGSVQQEDSLCRNGSCAQHEVLASFKKPLPTFKKFSMAICIMMITTVPLHFHSQDLDYTNNAAPVSCQLTVS